MIIRKSIRSTVSAGLIAASFLSAPFIAAPALAEQVGEVGVDWTGNDIIIDAGNATDERQAFRLKPGYGLGARWRSPAGPLAVDLAYGHDDRTVRLHFAIAVAF